MTTIPALVPPTLQAKTWNRNSGFVRSASAGLPPAGAT